MFVIYGVEEWKGVLYMSVSRALASNRSRFLRARISEATAMQTVVIEEYLICSIHDASPRSAFLGCEWIESS